MSKQTVTINGTVYDKVTGLPLRSVDTIGAPSRGHAVSMHARTQRSQTLSRKHLKRELKPRAASAPQKIEVTSSQPAIVAKSRPKATTNAPERSPMISKYAPHPVAQPKSAPVNDLTPATVHPVVAKAAANPVRSQRKAQVAPPRQPMHEAQAAPAKRTHKPSDVIKAEATAKALADAPSHDRAQHRAKPQQRSTKQRFGRLMSLASSGAALLLIAGYFTYINMPNLSVRVAAVQSGVDATYPDYRPSGYSISGPVAYENGEVRMAFAGNGTNQGFTLTQSKSGWDSSAVLDNHVAPKAGENYNTTTSGGLTVYTWGGNAAWVSKGILYTVDGDAPLSPDQVSRMAASL